MDRLWRRIVISLTERFSSRIIDDQYVFEKAAKNGTVIRILTEKPPPKSPIVPIINNFRECPNFQIRFLSFINVVIIIMDGNEVALALMPTNHVGPPYLVSDHPSFVHMAEQYFELRWKEATELESPKE